MGSVSLAVIQGLNGLLGLGSLVCAILVLIRLYNVKGTSGMLLGLFCTLYLFIWGWQNDERYGFAPQMRAWKLCLLGQVLCLALFLGVAVVAHG
jgi:hypothetical protein